MPYSTISELPRGVRGALTEEQQRKWLKVFNAAYEQYQDEGRAMAAAWSQINKVVKSLEITKAEISKLDEDRQLVFGWASISINKNGELVTDSQEDVIYPDDLEDAAYEYVLESRVGGEMHLKKGVSTLVESMVFTPDKIAKLGIPEGTIPIGWWVGFKVTDDEVWKNVKEGKYKAFSIHGSGVREEVNTDGQTA